MTTRRTVQQTRRPRTPAAGERRSDCSELRRGLLAGELAVHYQPVISLQDRLVVGFEALVRWNHPDRGLLNAAAFVPRAEECGLIRHVDEFVFREVCRQVAEWQEDVLVAPGFRVAVNVSGRDFGAPGFVDRLVEIIEGSGADPRCLAVELTETVQLDHLGSSSESVAALRSAGVGVVLDDFCTAYATFDRLRRFEFDTLKLDREMVQAALTPTGSALVRVAVELGRQLGMKLVAEGVESAEHAELMEQLGCGYGQGWLWSPAVSAADATLLLETGRFSLP